MQINQDEYYSGARKHGVQSKEEREDTFYFFAFLFMKLRMEPRATCKANTVPTKLCPQLQRSQLLKWVEHLDRPFTIEYTQKLTAQSASHCCSRNPGAKSTQKERCTLAPCRGSSPRLHGVGCVGAT